MRLPEQFPTLFGVARCHTTTNSFNRRRTQAVRQISRLKKHSLMEHPDLSLSQRAEPRKAHHHFIRMMGDGARPDEFTFSVIMSAVLSTKFNVLVPQLHGLVLHLGLDRQNYVESALMKGYIGLGDRDGFSIAFDEVAVKNVVVCNVLLLGYVEFRLIGEAKMAFDSMSRRDACSWNTMINGFMKKNRMMSEARQIFDSLPEKDVVSWNSMITGCTQCEKFVEALDICVEMMSSGTCSPNGRTFSSALHACSGCSCLATGDQLHACLLKFGIPLEVFLGNSLIDMYAKSGDVDAAFRVFRTMKTKNLVSWNSIIGGYARYGLADRVLEEFQRMIMSNTRPNWISLINVLSACAHGGKVKEAEAIFDSMKGEYGVPAEIEHSSCYY